MDGKVMDGESDILVNRSVLLRNINPSGREQDTYIWVCKALGNDNIKNIVWVCFNRPASILKKIFEENNIKFDKPIWFVDMISGCSSPSSEYPDVVQCASPTDYTRLHTSIGELLNKYPKTVVVFDNLNAIMCYNPDTLTIKLMRTMNNIIPQKDSAVLYIYTPGATDDRINVAIISTVEKVCDIGGLADKSILNSSWADLKKITWLDMFSLRHDARWIFILIIMTIFANILLIVSIVLVLRRLNS